VDAQEIQAAVAHKASLVTTADAEWTNPRDPARALGPDGRPAAPTAAALRSTWTSPTRSGTTGAGT